MPEPAPRANDAPSYATTVSLKLTLKGQLVQSYGLEQDTITVGRDPQCDVYVDNPGVSRQHFRIERGDTGEFRVVDAGSSNGTYLNDRPVKVATLRDGDTVQFGKYALEVGIDELVGAQGSARRGAARGSEGATVMLSPAEVRHMVAEARAAGQAGTPSPAAAHQPPLKLVSPAAPPVTGSQSSAWRSWIAVCAVTLVAAAIAIWLLAR